MFKKLLAILMILTLTSLTYAATTGKIVGIITDKQSGEPLPGVNVTLDDTYLGASTDISGYFLILNVYVPVWIVQQ